LLAFSRHAGFRANLHGAVALSGIAVFGQPGQYRLRMRFNPVRVPVSADRASRKCP
jgi:hypothetical protein